MRKIGFAVIVLAAFFLTVTSASALVFTDTTTKAGFDIDYELTWSLAGGSTYNATFTIDPNSSSGDTWWASGFLFKFDGSTPSEVTNLSAGWVPVDGTTNDTIHIDGFSRSDGFSGFYAAGLDPQGGLIVSGDTALTSITFDFTLPAGGTLNELTMPFKVGYWDGDSGGNGPNSSGYKFGQLSEDLNGTKVPEPGTLLLLGSGLVGLALFRRKIKA